MYQLGIFLFFTACFVLTLFLIYQGMKLIKKTDKKTDKAVKKADKTVKQTAADVKKKVNDAAMATDTFISCPKCHAKLRVPKGKGAIIVTCPKCKHRFQHNSGTLGNDLDLYRPGGPLRRAPTGHPSGSREALLELLAVHSASGMRTTYYDRSTGLRDQLEATGGSKVDYIEVQFTATRTVENVHWKNRSVPVVDIGTAYNDMVKGNRETICLNSTEVGLVRQMALSKLADDVPTAFMHDGRLYPHGRKSASGSSVQTSKR